MLHIGRDIPNPLKTGSCVNVPEEILLRRQGTSFPVSDIPFLGKTLKQLGFIDWEPHRDGTVKGETAISHPESLYQSKKVKTNKYANNCSETPVVLG